MVICVCICMFLLPGFYCSLGLAFPCPAGKFQSQYRRSSPLDCLPCLAGYWCGPSCGALVPCGGDSVYCPANVSAPVPVEPGSYTVGLPGISISINACIYASGLPGILACCVQQYMP
jgi:hypothetical protein